MHLRQPGLRIKKFKETGYSQYIYQKELDKVSFQHDIASGDFKSLARRTASDKKFCDKAFNIAKNPKNDVYQRQGRIYMTIQSQILIIEPLFLTLVSTFIRK